MKPEDYVYQRSLISFSCPNCRSSDKVVCVHSKENKQEYYCKECNKYFSMECGIKRTKFTEVVYPPCPACKSPETNKKGFSEGVQKYYCKICGLCFRAPKDYKKEANTSCKIICKVCGSMKVQKDAYTQKGIQKYYCKSWRSIR